MKEEMGRTGWKGTFPTRNSSVKHHSYGCAASHAEVWTPLYRKHRFLAFNFIFTCVAVSFLNLVVGLPADTADTSANPPSHDSSFIVQDCGIYENCSQCLEAMEHYCGWCFKENKCSLSKDCGDATHSPQHWVSYKSGKCPTITKVTPDKLQRTTARTLSVTVKNQPFVEGSLECVFSSMGKDLITYARNTTRGVSCTTPRTDLLPSILHNEHHFDVVLSVRKADGPKLASTNFTFFDCNTYSTCTECVSSEYPCDWCVDGHRCTHDTVENCRNDIIINGVKRIGPSIRQGKSFCPKISSVDSNEILVSSGTEKAIRVKVDNIAQFITQTRFVCQFNIGERVSNVRANLIGNNIYCDSVEFPFMSKTDTINATFAVIWGGSKPLDNPDNIHVFIYQCNRMADMCDTCLSLKRRFRCGWCQSDRNCKAEEQCSAESWLNNDQACPNISTSNSGLGEIGTRDDTEDHSEHKTNESELHSTNSTLVECNTYSSCSECVSSEYPCNWSVNRHRCTHEAEEDCRNDILINGVSSVGPSIRSGKSFCPRISSVESDEILVSSGSEKVIKVKVENIEVFNLKVHDCSIYESCSQCLKTKDQYCGWCFQENKCSLSKDCGGVTHSPQHWVSYKSGKCPIITKVQPDKLQSTTARTLSITVKNQPFVEGSLECVFSSMGKDLITYARNTNRGVSCTTPRTDLLPSILHNEHHFDVVLSVRKADGPKLASTNFTFFDCNTYSTCTECVSSEHPCDWCVDGHRCTHDAAENCRNDIIINGINRIGPSIRRGKSFCPRISSVESNEILVSSGTEKAIKVKVESIAQFIVQTRFVCQFNIEGRVASVNAQLLADTIYCDTIEFIKMAENASTNVTLAVIWGGSKPLDNPDNIHVIIYQCEYMAYDCSICSNLTETYRCGWCQSTNKCELEEHCSENSWLNRDQVCPNISFTELYPKSGSPYGETHITGKEFPSTNFTFFDCNTYSTCTECVSSEYPCDWCVDGHRCTNVTAENCRNDVIINSINYVGPSIRSGKSFCPRISSVESNEILVSSGTEKAIKVKVENIAQFIVQTRFVCQFNIEGRVASVNAQLLANTIYCDTIEFIKMAENASTNVTLAVIWGGSKPLDNPDNIHVIVYRCKHMAYNCSMCLNLAERYICGWCQSTNKCEVEKHCSKESWLNRDQVCPAISSMAFNPKSGSPDGGRHVTGKDRYDCSRHSSCTDCVSSEFLCDWCAGGHRCTHDAEEDCRNEIHINNVNRVGPDLRKGKSFCPKKSSVESTDILVSSGTTDKAMETKFRCKFNVEGRVTTVNSQLIGDVIHCGPMKFSYKTKGQSMNATFAVIWGGSSPLDNPDNIHVVIYRCNRMANKCDKCLSLHERYKCGWCQSTNKCKVEEQCLGESWLNHNQTCPNVSISEFYPKSGLQNESIFVATEDDFNVSSANEMNDGPMLASTNPSIFDCNMYSSCTECVSSDYACAWCVDRHQCTHDVEVDCKNDIHLNNTNRVGLSLQKGKSACQQISSVENKEISMSSDTFKTTEIKTDSIQTTENVEVAKGPEDGKE